MCAVIIISEPNKIITLSLFIIIIIIINIIIHNERIHMKENF